MHQGKSEYDRNYKWLDSFKSKSFNPTIEQIAPPAGCESIELGTYQWSMSVVGDAWCWMYACCIYMYIFLCLLIYFTFSHIILFSFHDSYQFSKLWIDTKSCCIFSHKKQACDVMELFDKVNIRDAKYLCSEIKIFNSTS